jgi:uncharacterized iron-regulated membrane protein
MRLITRPIDGADRAVNAGAAYRAVWRWHFYAGLFCLPFIAILSASGSVYLFKPQIDAYLDRPYDRLALASAPKSLDAQVAAALAANPGTRLKALELRADRADAARVRLMTSEGEELRAMVRPDTLEIMRTEAEKSRISTFMHDLHGQLLLGEGGAVAVELAGAWAIVMVITGLYLWWPRSDTGFAGVLYPRLKGGGRVLLRDLHAVTGVWLSFFALFFLVTALPWTKVWGESFKYVRSIGQQRDVRQDWTTGPASALARRVMDYANAPTASAEIAEDAHAEHRDGSAHSEHSGHAAMRAATVGFDEISAIALPLNLADPVLISPPSPKRPSWLVRSETQNRPLRASFEFDPKTFKLVREKRFSDGALVDRVIGIGVAAHEGQLFGWLNQFLGLLTAIGYLLLVGSSILMWWRRRPRGALGAPPALSQPPRLAPAIVALVAVLGVLLPTLGISLLLVLATERLIGRFAPRVALWLGLSSHRFSA